MKYQFQIDGHSFGAPIRDRWEYAAQDAVSAAYGIWLSDERVALDNQVRIVSIRERS